MGERTNRRTCDRCGSVLARDNPGSLCNPCARTVVGDSAAVPAHSTIFWEHPNIKAALGARHFGHLMYAYRLAHDPPVTQAELGHWLGLTQGQVSRIERSASPVRNLERLDRWARVMRVPSDKLWFQPDPHAADVPEETACASDPHIWCRHGRRGRAATRATQNCGAGRHHARCVGGASWPLNDRQHRGRGHPGDDRHLAPSRQSLRRRAHSFDGCSLSRS